MKKTMKELHEEKANVLAAANSLKEKAAAEKRDFTESEETEFGNYLGKLDVVNGEIKKAETRKAQFERLQAESASNSGNTVDEVAATSGLKEMVKDDPKRGFKHFGEFASAVRMAMTPGARANDERLSILSATGMSQGVGADGGFVNPPEFSTQIWDGMNKQPDNLLARTDSYTVQGESLTFPANAETSRATGSRYGGIRGYWISEAGQISSSKPTLRQVKLEPQQLAVLCYVTDKLLNNSPIALNQYLTRAATEEIAFLVNDAIINGTGAGQPKGLLQSASRVTVAKEVGQAAKTIVLANVVNMFSRLHPRCRQNAAWFMNQDIEPQLMQLNAAVGAGGQLVYLPPGGLSAAPYATLFGRPVLPIEYAATLGAEGDLILADLGAYATGTKGGVEEAMSIHLKFDYAETAFRFMFAVDGQPWLASPITPFKGSNTQSACVTLAVRA
jgi:HK97 family phage major capsid protein